MMMAGKLSPRERRRQLRAYRQWLKHERAARAATLAKLAEV